MAIDLPDPRTKALIVSETSPWCQCTTLLAAAAVGAGLIGERIEWLDADNLQQPTIPRMPPGLWPEPVRLMQPAQLLGLLAAGKPLSGSTLAAEAGVTRAAIWKQVESLRARGLPVEARGAAGYCLPWPLQMLDEDRIRAELPSTTRALLGSLDVHWELDSTSTELQRRAATASDGSIMMAETQTAGRGRRGRHWLSPPGMNLYLSCLKRFESGFSSLSGLSLAVGVIVMRALEQLGVPGAGLKWPNDVLAAAEAGLGGKLGGILVELSGEYQGPCAATIGIGLNLRLTPELRAQAGQPTSDLASLAGGVPPDRNRVAATLIAALLQGLQQFELEGFAGFTADYARYDLLHGRPISVSGAAGEFTAVANGIDARGALLVLMPDGSARQIDSAEVSVRIA